MTPPSPLSPRSKTVLGAVLALLVMLASYLGLKSPCPPCECNQVVVPPAATGDAELNKFMDPKPGP